MRLLLLQYWVLIGVPAVALLLAFGYVRGMWLTIDRTPLERLELTYAQLAAMVNQLWICETVHNAADACTNARALATVYLSAAAQNKYRVLYPGGLVGSLGERIGS